MKNEYDNPHFFDAYSQMTRSKKGLEGAGEWYELKKLLPDFTGRTVLDLGCGYGWHCRYAVEQGAEKVIGIDLSERMIERAQAMTDSSKISYLLMSMEEIDTLNETFDIVISSLSLHYVSSFDTIAKKVNDCLKPNGDFIFSTEHPIFSAQGTQEWIYDQNGQPLYWPVDRYFDESIRETSFLGEQVLKYHKTLTTYINGLLINGFQLTHLIEPMPAPEMLAANTEMRDELRRPMMLIVSAKKTTNQTN
ncbi:SAM-dependent methyltransferase [Enterococcus ureilyticus]|uniref:SAM-dependent methyltransferase n=1 Tax=Enterococcus ureilyticus TaxID=1131292 RepID=A0A1E5HBK4_9ENTE|nr:class I SAM-dependent methyltransferase [Enterococcus ureilyticus]MBM7690090.1 2-polyprenyl-3-methyl-5-hydroxy-6-metoxy-1,4-benzoquinol methylase [Enterococcus ureilyticus]OEG22216.1 SAM-dependent methyltransferase [Enterococcus ureilyticus]